ncbi:MAG TPA: LptA/OstA family protein [Terracidiphilus sp.]|nr:LptA/OstA family protein [Terracidiphilus sp.]
MRFTIERIRTAILVAGVLLVMALGVFLAVGRWKSPFNRRDLPKKLGIGIQQEANGFTHAEFHAGHALFKITASKVEQLKDSRYRLHSVRIEMYGPNNAGADRIEGSEFEYDQKQGIATASGPVEITLDRPSPAQQRGRTLPDGRDAASKIQSADSPDLRQIHVKTVGLTFNQNTGVASAANHVEFDVPEASGSAMSASYDSQRGELVLSGAVQLTAQRGTDPVAINAQRADFARDAYLCTLSVATARYRHGDARAQEAKISFREDGSAEQLDASNGLELVTRAGGHITAPQGSIRFSPKSQPTFGHLEGGVVLDSNQGGRSIHGKAPSAELQFSPAGLLRRVHLERGTDFVTEEQTNRAGTTTHAHRAWRSPAADIDFHEVGPGRVEIASVHGTGGVVVTSETQRGVAPALHARMTADDMLGGFGPKAALASMIGSGHAVLEQTTDGGARQITSGDRVEAHFAESRGLDAGTKTASVSGSAIQIEKATVIGHVVLMQQAETHAGTTAPSPLRATAERADYEGAGEWLHLTGSPHVENGEVALDAEKVDVDRASGDAFARGTVKATWFGSQAIGMGGQGPAHIVADDAQLHQATGAATFSGHARLWQQANSVAAPVIVLDRNRQVLSAQTTRASDPVKVVLVGAGNAGGSGASGKSTSPSVVRVRGGDLKYSEAERKGIIRGGVLGSVVAETAGATTRSNEVDLILMASGNHAGKEGGAAQVDRLTARGSVSIESQGRRGTGERLDYSSDRGEYVLTGTAANPPRMTDPARGTVTGESLIFNSRDDSVNVEGGQRATTTETTAPKRP